MKQGENHNSFPLARRPSSAIEKAAPGAKRILSGMVADALMLAKPIFTILISTSEVSDLVELLIKKDWQQKFTLKFVRFTRASELLNLAGKPFNLIFLYVLNVRWDANESPFKFLGALKAKHGKPIIATQGLDWTKEFEGTGVTFLNAPFSIEAIQDVLTKSFLTQTTDLPALAKNKTRKKLRIVVLDDEEWCLELFSICIQMLFKEVTLLKFQHSEAAWQELSQTDPDLLILDMQLVEPGLLPLLAEKKVKYPILATSGLYGEKEVLERADSNLNVSFIPKPFGMEDFRKALETALKIPRATPMQNEIISPKSRSLNRRGRLLVVDDEDGPRQSLRVIFENEYDMFFAEDGVTAIKLVQENDIDVVVTDICMPGMSGIEVLERVKYIKPDIEVIIMTTFETPETRLKARQLGASDYINVPFDLVTMRAAVSKAMQRRTLQKRNTAKLSIAVCGHCDESFCEWLGAIFHDLLSAKYTVKIESFIFADGLFEAAQGRSFDLFIVFLNPRLPREVDAHELVVALKRKFQKPILILTNEIIYALDSAAGFKQAGADAFFSFMPPFPPAGFKEALEKCVSKTQEI